jgi:excisionase family DNA binding protein
MSDDWLSVEQAARALGISTKTVRRKIASGELPSRKEPTPRGERWLVQLSGQIAPSTTLDTGQNAPVQSLLVLSQGFQALQEHNTGLAQELARVQDERVDMSRQLGRLEAELAAARTEVERLKKSRPWWQRWTRP